MIPGYGSEVRAALTVAGFASFLAACSSYYEVRDPATSRQYYTSEFDRAGSGAVTFKDAKSGAAVTLQNSEVREISEDDFTKAVAKPAK